jgi:hypothetical protein
VSNLALDALIDHRRRDWGGGQRPRALTPVVHPYIEVHHSAGASHYDRDPLAVALTIERDHLGRGWNGAFYGLLVATDGRIIELRGVGWRSIGEHRARYGDGTTVDPGSLTVLLPGDYVTQHTTAAQRNSLDRIRAAVPDPRLRWHGMRDNTACPGTYGRAALQLLNARPPAPPEVPMVQIVIGQDRQGRWWRFRSTSDFGIELDRPEADFWYMVDPSTFTGDQELIERLKRANALVPLTGGVIRG